MHAECTKLHNSKCCALRGFLNLMAPNFELCCFLLPQFYLKSHDTFHSLTQDSSYVFSASSSQFGITFAYFRFWILRNKPNKDSLEALVHKASDSSWMCQRGLVNIYISTGFLSVFSFWKIQPKRYWIFNCDFWIWPLCTLTDRISQTHEDDTFWCMQWHKEVIADLIALYFINFHEVGRKLWEYELSGYFLFFAQYIITHNSWRNFALPISLVKTVPKCLRKLNVLWTKIIQM